MTTKVKRDLGLVLVGVVAFAVGMLLTRTDGGDDVTQVATALVLGAIVALAVGGVRLATDLLRG